jgi:tRNA (guanine6-N2)-methyltransferase
MKTFKIYTHFIATIVAGLEAVLADELSEFGIDRNIIRTERGKVIFSTQKSLNELIKLRCADNIYCIISEFPVGCHKADLKQYTTDINKLKWHEILSAFDADNRKINVSASRKGKATFSRFDIEEATKVVLFKAGYEIANEVENAVHIRVDFQVDFCRISIKLTNAEFRFHGNTHIYTKGCIRPTIASALVRISKPCKTDIFYDLFCGSGSIVCAREEFPAKRILASDIDEETVKIAKENCNGKVIVFCCDAAKTFSKPNSVDVIVSNPPWNKQVVVDETEKFYIEFIAEAKRILKVNGKIILLTDCCNEIFKATEQNAMKCIGLFELSLHGLRPKVFEITN